MSDDPLSDEQTSRIADAIESIEESRTALRQKQSLSPTEYKSPTNRDLRKATERDFVTLAEAIVDVAEIIVTHEHDDVPTGRKQKVRGLHSVGVLDEEVTHKLEEAVSFRDVLSHTYGPIVNDDLVYDALQSELDRYIEFTEAISDYLRANTDW